AANTMDSMLGYKNERYLRFGCFSAKLDDALNYLPSRLTALLMILSAYLSGMNGGNAYRIWRRDRLNHASPNSAQTEAVCAGALGVMLAGDAVYFGKLVKKQTIGDDLRRVTPEAIPSANRLMYVTSVLMLLLTLTFRTLLFGVLL
ncbi:MAG: cobalamin biosynthesis protein, partial [Clostridia bacterium]|nr:cobalamin biosynthesis protein [Clostridia bacterium]